MINPINLNLNIEVPKPVEQSSKRNITKEDFIEISAPAKELETKN